MILLPAFVVSALFVLSHTYLGLHVLARGIIFVDLALAQVAAFGASVAILFGLDVHSPQAQLMALAATLVAAGGFTWLRRVQDKTTREVVIGSVYVVTTALAVVVLSQSARGLEELKALLNGSILWVQWSEIGLVAAVTAGFGLLHVIWRRRFHDLSFDDGGGPPAPGFWEFAFFGSFAVVITIAVGIAGILVVFAFLIIPAFSASLLTGTFRGRLVLGWLLGIIGALCGLAVSYAADLPVGATVVSVLGLLPILAGVVRAARS